jgi:SEC-C motif-containing protein
MSKCPCQSGKEYDACCGPIISGRETAATPEALMRSRYSAFAKGEVEHLGQSLHPGHRADYDPISTKQWADQAEWLGLDIVNTSGGGKDDEQGTVEFIATYRQKGVSHAHHEIAEFSRHNGIWYYTDGKIIAPGTVRHQGPKVGRNDPCPCGSGKKFKKCCGSKAA